VIIDSDTKGSKKVDIASKPASLMLSTDPLSNLPELSKLHTTAVKGLTNVSYGLK
jgi:hypothetical protein